MRPVDLSTMARAEHGRLLFWAGRVLLGFAFAAPFVAIAGGEQLGAASLTLRLAGGLAAAVLLGVAGGLMVSYGQRMQVRPGEPAIADRAARLVLYLRAFTADSTIARTVDMNVLPTAEQTLRERVAPVGEMVAIGRPGEPLPPIGAPRAYRTDEAWRNTVLDLMRRSRLTILAYGTSPGLLWEIEQAQVQVPPDRLVLWFPTRATWRAFVAMSREQGIWARPLPTTSADVHLLGSHADGSPRILEVHWTNPDADFATTVTPDPTEPGEVSAGGFEAYVRELAEAG